MTFLSHSVYYYVIVINIIIKTFLIKKKKKKATLNCESLYNHIKILFIPCNNNLPLTRKDYFLMKNILFNFIFIHKFYLSSIGTDLTL